MKKISLLLIIICALFFTRSAFAAQITVDSNNDTQVTDGNCTLREAIANANSNSDGTGGDCVAGSGTDTIVFSTAMTIELTEGVLSISSPIIIDGTSGGLGNCTTKGLGVVVSGEFNGNFDSFILGSGSDGSVIKGLVIQNAGLNGVSVTSSANIQILCNMFGLSQNGDTLAINGTNGISLVDTNNIQVGGPNAGEGNIITGNDTNGIMLDHAPNTSIWGNWIGLNRTGDDIFTAQELGISVIDSSGLSNDLVIGGSTSGHSNIITGNNEANANGLHSDSGIDGLVMQGNYWGTASDLTTVIPVNPGVEGNHFEIAKVTNFSIMGNVFAGNGTFRGIHVLNGDTGIIQGNFVGVAADGVTSLVSSGGFIENPVSISGSTNIQFGGDGAGEYNVIGDTSGISWSLVSLSSNNNNSTYYGNFIGVGSDGTTNLSVATVVGVTFSENDKTLLFGGTGAGQANIIANSGYGVMSLYDNTTIAGNIIKNNQLGVLVADTSAAAGLSSRVTLSQNSIYQNASLGIELSKDTNGDFFAMDENIGKDLNDYLDADTGPNNYLNHPVLISATQNGSDVDMVYMLDVPVSVNPYRVEFFSNPSGLDSSGFGQGEVYEGSDEQTVSTSGPQIFTATISNANAADGITATATDCTDAGCTTYGGTSEFSNGITGTSAGIDMGTATGTETALVDNGPYHVIKTGVRLGATIGTDAIGSVDVSDRDGVVFDAVTYPPSATITATVTASVDGYINAWIDADANGTFETQLFSVNNAVVAGSNTLVFVAPSAVGSYSVRFRYTDYQPTSLQSTGEALNGEVEDYTITVAHPVSVGGTTSSSSGRIPLAIWNSITKSSSVTESGACSADQLLTQNMRAGARNGKYHPYTKAIVKEVKILQAHMNRLGFKSGSVDGILGPITDGAIKRMQTFLGTKADGYIGPITRSLINTSCGSLGLQRN